MIRPIDIVVPVYNARELLQRCLAALDRHTPVEQARILIVDDASPDPDIAPLLANWARTSPLRPRKTFSGVTSQCTMFRGWPRALVRSWA